jgi:Flp pilus assembly pilin Flp
MSTFRTWIRSTGGQAAPEYAVVLALAIAIAMVVLTALGGAISDYFDTFLDAI